MVIAINTRLLLPGRIEGIGRFSCEILKRISLAHKEHTFIFFFDRNYDPSFIFSDNIVPVVLFPPSRHPVLWYWFFEYSVTRALEKYKADIFITTDGWLSTRTRVKTLQVLHDLHYENYPNFLPLLTRRYYQYFFPKYVKKATRIVTVSKFCQNEIIQTYGINRTGIDVVYNSTREEYHSLSDDEILKVRKEYTGGYPYFLFIGPVHPRKNLDNAIKAFIQYRKVRNDGTKLVITGSRMWRNFGQTIKIKDPEILRDILFTGYLSPEELFRITGAAICLLYVSFYEGFGMPVLEAMSCNVPVIASDRSAIPEITGDAAILVDPASVDSITNALFLILDDEKLRQSLILRGQSNLKRFSWDESASLFWQSIIKTMQ